MNTEAEILKIGKNIAVVGISPDPGRPSHQVSRYMRQCGYNIIHVNPMCKEVFGLVCYPKLSDVPAPVDIVNVFRRSEEAPAIVEDAVKIKAKAVWLQEGVVSDAARKRAEEAGLLFIEDE